MEDFDEEVAVQRATDRLHPATSGGRRERGGSLSKAGISEATYYNWRKKYGGLMPSEMKRLKQLDEENRRLKKLVADLSLDKEMLQDVIRRKIGDGLRARPAGRWHEDNTPFGLYTRLHSHASGRRSGDQFCVYVADRLVLPSLSQEEIASIASARHQMD